MATQPSEPDRSGAADGSPRKRLTRFVQRARERAEQAKAQFTVHGITYGAVNGLLALINLLTAPDFLWFLFPAAGWGIGLLHHYTEARSRAQEAREAAALPPAGKGELKLVRKLFRSRRGLRHHLSTTVGVTALLAGINLFLMPEAGPWFLIPIAALGGSLAIHAGTARERIRRLRDQLQHAGAAPGREADVAALEADDEAAVPAAHAPLLVEAEELRAAILTELQDGGEDTARWRSALQPELATYTGHVRALLQERRDLERAAARVSADDATRQLDDLRGKLETATSDGVGCYFIGAHSGESTAELGALWDGIALSDNEQEVVDALRVIDPHISRVTMVGGYGSRQRRTAFVRTDSIPTPFLCACSATG